MKKLTERIGKITLDYKHYPGEDYYCDGIIEDKLLEIVKNNTPDQYEAIIEERSDWETLYHLSPLRENIVEWLPIDKTMKVLEVGSGCGAITGALARKAKNVTCIELSKKRSYINAYRHQEINNIGIEVGNFKDIEPELPVNYDYIILIGVFEYGQSYMGTETPYEDFMAILKKHLNPNGKMVIAIENKFGLKYWAGCKEDHLGTYFSGIEDYPDGGSVRTFTRKGLESIMSANKIEDYHFYYPYPDYKFMSAIYSDAYLPKVGELTTNARNFDRERMQLFDEKNVFDTIIREELFPLYANSYLVVIGDELDIKFSKYSNEREAEFSVRTDIKIDTNDQVYVEKVPLTEEAKTHINSIKMAYDDLTKRYEGSDLKLNTCVKTQDGIGFEFLEGPTLEELLDYYLLKGDMEEFYLLLKEYLTKIDYNKNQINVTDYDLIFSNIIVNEDGWHIIDYEWTFHREMPTKEVAYRAFYCYTLGGSKRQNLDKDKILKLIGITQKEALAVEKEEIEFQTYATGKKTPMGVMRNRIGHKMIDIYEIITDTHIKESSNQIQIYPDCGQGYSEETAYFIQGNEEKDSNKRAIAITVNEDVQQLRIDPFMEACIVTLELVKWNGSILPSLEKGITTNGSLLGERVYIFATDDPNLVFNLQEIQRENTNTLEVFMEVTKISMELAVRLQTKRGIKECLQGLKTKLKK